MKFGVLIFPGSNCDHDAYWTLQQVAKQPVTFLWHESHDLENCDAIIVPGGFAFGDYLRTGAIAKFSPVMESVKEFANGGGIVLGICNGFQILCESGLLPGALMRNVGLKYICKPVQVRVESTDTMFTSACRQGEVLTIPIGHMEGNYFCDEATLAELGATSASSSAIRLPMGKSRQRRIPTARSTTSGESAILAAMYSA
jgi:phosphoribosylformylglycinamidine synthase